MNFPNAPCFTKPAKYMSVSARMKLSTVTGTALPVGACAARQSRHRQKKATGDLNRKILHGSVSFSLRSLLDVRQLPDLVEERLLRPVEAEQHLEFPARRRLEPSSIPFRPALSGPK